MFLEVEAIKANLIKTTSHINFNTVVESVNWISSDNIKHNHLYKYLSSKSAFLPYSTVYYKLTTTSI